jgi:hypothetical protein
VPTDPYSPFKWSVEQDHIKIDLYFNRSVRKETVMQGSSLLLSFSKDPNAELLPGHPIWFSNNTYCYFMTKKKYDDLLQGGPNDIFTLKLVGSDTPSVAAIRDEDGLALDGDYDNSPGGDYLTYFVLVG